MASMVASITMPHSTIAALPHPLLLMVHRQLQPLRILSRLSIHLKLLPMATALPIKPGRGSNNRQLHTTPALPSHPLIHSNSHRSSLSFNQWQLPIRSSSQLNIPPIKQLPLQQATQRKVREAITIPPMLQLRRLRQRRSRNSNTRNKFPRQAAVSTRLPLQRLPQATLRSNSHRRSTHSRINSLLHSHNTRSNPLGPLSLCNSSLLLFPIRRHPLNIPTTMPKDTIKPLRLQPPRLQIIIQHQS
mmetsp:Transcript_12733/g.27097  ORF Transcript_12733/g.27097 Transcript_12733/m.27097 type:complete len:245 (-) Transcript_12733:351-1085(-)